MRSAGVGLLAGWLVLAIVTTAGCETDPGTPVATPEDDAARWPTLWVVTIRPSLPRTTDDLVAAVESLDAKPFTVAWRRDGVDAKVSGQRVASSLTAKHERWEVVILADGAEVATRAVVIANSPPRCASASVGPAGARAGATLSCGCSGLEDADGDPVDVSCQLGVAGAIIPGCEVMAPSRGERVTCTVRVHDGEDAGPSTEAPALTVADTPPAGGTVTVHPPAARETDTLTCNAEGAVDPDGPVSWTFAWWRNGAAIPGPVSPTLGGTFFEKGDRVRCVATPVEGEVAGPAVPSAGESVIGDTPPSVDGAALDRAEVGRRETLTCSVSGLTDADPADAPSVRWSWVGAGKVLPGETGPTLTPAGLLPGDAVTCRATPFDGESDGATAESAPATVVNRLPSLSGASLAPAEATATSLLECTPTGWADPDEDAPGYQFAWLIDETVVAGASGPTLDHGFAKGQSVRCRVTPHDGFDAGPTVTSDAVVVLNTLPTLAGVTLEPAAAGPCQTFACLPSGLVDPDPTDAPTIVFGWTVNGVAVPTSGSTLPAAGLAVGDQVQCSARATDGAPGPAGLGGGPTVVSGLGTVVNTAPSLASVLVSPDAPGPDDVLTCQPVGYEDAECPAQGHFTFRWLVGGSLLAGESGASLDLGAYGIPDGAIITCQARPDDGFLTGVFVTSNPVTVVTPPPDTPKVLLVAPFGADGQVTCAVLTGEPLNPADIHWFWRINGGPETPGPKSLAAAQVANCDRLRCRAEVTTAIGVLVSNTSELQLTVGPDCDDDNACTAEACAPAGGCVSTAVSADCDDQNPCTAADGCHGGTCGGIAIPDGTACTPGDPSQGYCTAATCTPNAAPTAPTVTLLPAAPTVKDELTCLAAGAVDADGWPAPLTLGFTWRVGGVVVGGATSATLPAGAAQKGQVVTCEVVATDGDLASAAGTAQVTLKNAPPTVTAPQLGPVGGGAPAAGQDMVCAATVADPDAADVVTRVTRWWVNDTLLGVTGATLAGGFVPPCGRLRCRVEATDGAAAVQADSAVVTLGPAGCGPNPCMTWSCTAAGACAGTANTADCDDQNQCTTFDRCQSGVCKGVATWPADCDDNNPCTDTGCDPTTGCKSIPNLKPCDDQSVCTSGDACFDGSCRPGAPAPCGDSPSCQGLGCDPVLGCQQPVVAEETDMPVELGIRPLAAAFHPAVPDDPLELQQGVQGGVHVELALRTTLPSAVDWTPTQLRITSELHGPCCDGPLVGSSISPTSWADLQPDGTYVSSWFPVFMQSSNVSLYVGLSCCVRVTVEIQPMAGGPAILVGRARHVFTCVNDL